MSLAETLQQVRATAERLERDIDQSRSYRAQMMNQEQYQNERQNTESTDLIVDIRNDAHIREAEEA